MHRIVNYICYTNISLKEAQLGYNLRFINVSLLMHVMWSNSNSQENRVKHLGKS